MEKKEVVMTENKKKSSLVKKLALVGVAVALLLIYLVVPPVNKLINDIIKMFQTGNFASMRAFIAQYGAWAMLVSSLLMIFQSLAAPPACVLHHPDQRQPVWLVAGLHPVLRLLYGRCCTVLLHRSYPGP